MIKVNYFIKGLTFMSKFGIFMLGVAVGTATALVISEKGRGNMGTIMMEKTKTLDEQLFDAIMKKNPKFVELKADENGQVIIDKEKHPNLYDWVENG
jgi:triphosphoribosyl-dephospho-CoA synthetase